MRDTLHTDRLILRPFDLSDVEVLVQACNDWDIVRQTATLPYPYEAKHAREWIQSMGSANEPRPVIYAISHQNALIGCISLHPKDGSWDLGYWLAKDKWRQGFMREAITALLQEANLAMPEATLVARVFADNPRSLALLNGNGFRESSAPAKEFCVARQTEVQTFCLTRARRLSHA